ncbi:MAG: pantoate--beta-alanine ligase [Candidatus Aminicenantes bacterium]|nr:pantoate--beta-alanine ligase [Candidatus Aminicenantes bacterium]
METIQKIGKMRAAVREVKSQGKSIGFVPTMGYLHEGHLSLVRESLNRTDVTVVSIFVNPTQFGPKEDFRDYPRDRIRDSEILERLGVDYVFCPNQEEMYPPGYKTYVEVHDLQDKLCGRSREGHFRGVSTVVLKLFAIVQPDNAYFGQKDAQQAIILKRMVEDLDSEVRIEVLPIVREPDGLAMSSRNVYLDSGQRRAALCLFRSLQEAEKMTARGECRASKIIGRIKDIIQAEPLAKIDYVAVVDSATLVSLEDIHDQALVALAVYIGKVRLIDNTLITLER